MGGIHEEQGDRKDHKGFHYIQEDHETESEEDVLRKDSCVQDVQGYEVLLQVEQGQQGDDKVVKIAELLL